jgi:hypothetical protein
MFLWGGLLAAAPIVLHLLQRDTQGLLYYTATGLLFALTHLSQLAVDLR